MHTKLLSFLLVSSFLLGSFPAIAEEDLLVDVPAEAGDLVASEAPLTEESSSAAEPIARPEPLVAEPVTEVMPALEVPQDLRASSSELGIEESVAAFEMAPLAAEEASSTEALPSISLLIRYGENVAWSGTTTIPTGTTTISPTASTTEKQRAADALLSVVLAVDAASDSFEISDLDYYPSLDSFIINCIRSTEFPEACSQWQYVVNGAYPSVGIDQYELQDGDKVYLYFGQPRRVRLSDTTPAAGEPFTATAESYEPGNNSYGPFPNHTIGITIPNSWPPVEVATSTSGNDGTAVFTIAEAGSYEISLKMPSPFGDFYDYPPTSFTVSSTTSAGSGSGGATGTGSFDIPAAYDFLASDQNEDGSWDSDLVTDWSAVALAASGASPEMKSRLAEYLREEEPDLDSIRDYERHAMALMALGINPYSGGPDDYITPIVESFDGTQIDEPGIMNDDVFALIVLLNAGYDKDDDMIKKIVSFVVSEQKGNGSWENSVDMTAATIQALTRLRSLPGVSPALMRAEEFLREAQAGDGGFGDPFATAWALGAIEALGQSPDLWKIGDNTPLTYLGKAQEEDGGLATNPEDYSTRAWATAYAIPAVKGLTWDDLLRNFSKPKTSNDNSKESAEESDGTTATSTDETVVTSIIPVMESVQTQATPPPDTTVVPDSDTTSSAQTEPVTIATAPAQTEDSAFVEDEMSQDATSTDLAAAATESGAWEWLKQLIFSIWSLIKGLFA